MNHKHLFACLLLAALTPLVLPASVRADDETPDFETAQEAVEHMRLGWNLGNTLDSHSGDTLNMWIEANKGRTATTYETAWGQKTTKASLFKMFREAGFNAIRVPVTWYPHMEATFNAVRSYDDNGKWCVTPWLPSADDIGTKVQKAWMRRVKQVVDYVLGQGMYCIINVHHDTGAANTSWLVADEAAYARQHERFEALWTQIAEEFKDYDEHLLFEGYNEMLDVKSSWCFASFAASGNYNASIARSAYNAINSYAQSFVDAVRATGGNNLRRNLIVSTYGACDGNGTWNSHLQDPLRQMKLPTDSLAGHLIFEVHSYPDIKDLGAAKSGVRSMISNLKTYLMKKGAPVLFGEWGTLVENAYDEYRDNLLAFARYFVEQAKASGIATFYWMGLSDGQNRATPKFNQPDLVEALVKGYYGEAGFVDGIEALPADQHTATPVEGIFDLSGRKVQRQGLNQRHGRPASIYIVNGRKVVLK